MRFTGAAVPYTKKEYEEEIGRYAENLKQNESVVSVYRAGSIKYPGLSDIDIVIVLKDECTFPFAEYSVLTTEKRKYLFLHEPFVVPESLASSMAVLYPLQNAQCIWGKRFAFRKPTREEQLHFFIQEYVKGYMFWAARKIRSGVIDSRSIFPELHAVCYSLRVFHSVTGFSSPAFQKRERAFIRDITELRERFFRLLPEESRRRIIDLLYRSKELNDFMYAALDRYLEQHVCRVSRPSVYFGFFPRIVLFTDVVQNRETAIFRFLSKNFAIITDDKMRKIKNEWLRDAFRHRSLLIRKYEQFIDRNRLRRFMLLTSMH
jgi:hypothetical protein